jgi:single-stranded DNA-binding protein
MNVATLTGRLGGEPEITEFNDTGKKQAVVSIATKRRTGRRKGEEITTDWHRVKIIDSDTVANYVIPYLHTGTLVSVTGELTYEHNRSSQDPTNKSKFAQIIVSDPRGVQILAQSSQHRSDQRDGDDAIAPRDLSGDEPAQGV